MTYTFNGTTKRITLSLVTLDLVDLHSRWKEWLLLGNAGFEQAFRAVGGDIPAIPLYLFLLNGWRIVPMAADHTLTITNGVLEVDGGGDPFVDPVGSYKIRLNRQTPGIAIGYHTSETIGASSVEIAAAVLVELQKTNIFNQDSPTTAEIVSGISAAFKAAPPPVDLVRMQGKKLIGTGKKGDYWRAE